MQRHTASNQGRNLFRLYKCCNSDWNKVRVFIRAKRLGLFTNYIHIELELMSSQHPKRLSSIIDPADLAVQLSVSTKELTATSTTDAVVTSSAPTSWTLDFYAPSTNRLSLPPICSSTSRIMAKDHAMSHYALDHSEAMTSQDFEGVYDRFLMATSSVVRVGRGYQSDNTYRSISNNLKNKSQPRSILAARYLRHGAFKQERQRPLFGTSTEQNWPSINHASSNAIITAECQYNLDTSIDTISSISHRVKKALQQLVPSRR
jgi:hypothetical protein